MPEETVWVEIERSDEAHYDGRKVSEVSEEYVVNQLKNGGGSRLRVITRRQLSEFKMLKETMLDAFREIDENANKVKLVPVPYHVRPETVGVCAD